MRRVLRSPAILGEVKPRRVVLPMGSKKWCLDICKFQVCVSDGTSLQEFEYWWWDLAMVSTQGFYIRKVRRPPPSYQIYFSHWLCARTSHCPNSTATVSKSPSSHNATRSESTNWWSYMPDLARDSPPSSSHRPIKPSGSTRDRIYWSAKEAYISWHACSVTCVRDCIIPGDIKIWGWYVLHHRCVGSGLIFDGLVRIRSEKFNGGFIISYWRDPRCIRLNCKSRSISTVRLRSRPS